MAFQVRDIESFHGKQIILWLEDEATGATGPGDGTEWCVRITVDVARQLLPALFDSYAATMQSLAIDLAAGPCRTCGRSRTVNGRACPVCMPRAADRIRRAVMLQPKAPVQ